MWNGLLANSVVLFHIAFIMFVLIGGFLTWRWKWIAWAHIPGALWGAAVQFAGWRCPLTPLENHLRRLAGGDGYDGGFVEHYIMPLMYPGDWSAQLRVVLGTLVVILNVAAYLVYFRRFRRRSRDMYHPVTNRRRRIQPGIESVSDALP